MSIIQNALKINENGKISYIISKHRHDLVAYVFENKDSVFVDGGNSYLRRGFPHDESLNKCLEEWSLDDKKNSFEEIKNKLLWGTYGKGGNLPLKYVPLVECEEDHLNIIIREIKELLILYRDVINSILSDRYKTEEI